MRPERPFSMKAIIRMPGQLHPRDSKFVQLLHWLLLAVIGFDCLSKKTSLPPRAHRTFLENSSHQMSIRAVLIRREGRARAERLSETNHASRGRMPWEPR